MRRLLASVRGIKTGKCVFCGNQATRHETFGFYDDPFMDISKDVAQAEVERRRKIWLEEPTCHVECERMDREKNEKRSSLLPSILLGILCTIGHIAGLYWLGYQYIIIGGFAQVTISGLFVLFKNIPSEKQKLETLFFSDGNMGKRIGRYKGHDIRKKLSKFRKEHKLNDEANYLLKFAESRVSSYIESENKAKKALKGINKAYKVHQETRVPITNALKKSAKEFWLINKRGYTLDKEVDELLKDIKRLIDIEKVMDLPPLPDLFAESISEDISPLVKDIKERVENLEEAHKEIEEYLSIEE